MQATADGLLCLPVPLIGCVPRLQRVQDSASTGVFKGGCGRTVLDMLESARLLGKATIRSSVQLRACVNTQVHVHTALSAIQTTVY